MRAPHAIVMDQLVLLVLPDRALDVERRFARDKSPAVAPVVGVKGHMILIDFDPSGRQLHGEELFEFRGVELSVDHFIDESDEFCGQWDMIFSSLPRCVISFSHDASSILSNHGEILYSFAAFCPKNFLPVVRVTPSKLLARASWVFGQVEVASGNCVDQRMFSVPI